MAITSPSAVPSLVSRRFTVLTGYGSDLCQGLVVASGRMDALVTPIRENHHV